MNAISPGATAGCPRPKSTAAAHSPSRCARVSSGFTGPPKGAPGVLGQSFVGLHGSDMQILQHLTPARRLCSQAPSLGPGFGGNSHSL